MIRFLIHKPVSVIMTFIAFILLGLVALKRIPISLLPDIDIPELTVHTRMPDVPAKEIEETITAKLRSQLLQIPGLDDIHSETRDGYSIIRIRFNYGTDINYAFIEANEKIDLAMRYFPKQMERPRVIKASAADIPVFYINMRLKKNEKTSDNSYFMQMGEFAETVIKKRLEQLPEVALVDITGVNYPEIYIRPDEALMAALNIPDYTFKKLIAKSNIAFGNTVVRDGVLEYNVRFASAGLANAGDIRNISFKIENRIVRLGDIARVDVREQNAKGIFLAEGEAAVNMAIIKQSNTRMDDLRQKLDAALKYFEEEYKTIQFEVIQDQTQLLDFSISNLRQDLYLSILLGFFLMFFFFKKLRAPILIAITVPVSFIISILFLHLFDLSINIISLSGLVLGVGLMIDNSIIVIDNITQYGDRGYDLSSACVKGGNEIIRPLISSVLTTCSVFLPLIFLSGISGALFYEQAMAITICLIISFVVSIVLLPVLFRLFHLKDININRPAFFKGFGIGALERSYEAGFRWVFKHKLASLAIVMALVMINVFVFKSLKKERMPPFEESELMVLIDWNQNIDVAENRNRILELLKQVNVYMAQSACEVGEQQYLLNKDRYLSTSESRLYIKVADSKKMPLAKKIIFQYLSGRYPAATVAMHPPKNMFEQLFGENEPALIIKLTNARDNQLIDKGKVKDVMIKAKRDFKEAAVSTIAMQQLILVKMNMEKLLLYNMPVETVFDKLQMTISSTRVGNINTGLNVIPIVVSNKNLSVEDMLYSTTVKNKDGIEYHFSEFMQFEQVEDYKSIVGGKNGVYVPVYIETLLPEKVINQADQLTRDNDFIDMELGGSYFYNKRLIREMGLVLIISILLLYFILAAQFESLIQPLIVLLELPISMSGALIMLYVFGASINLMSLIGLVVICGIIINDSILKISVVNQLRRNEGYLLMDAIHTAGKRRLKSIVMTSLVTILSVVPFLFGNDMGSVLQRPLSLALIGGMSLGTLVSLYFIPLVYWWYYNKSDKRKSHSL